MAVSCICHECLKVKRCRLYTHKRSETMTEAARPFEGMTNQPGVTIFLTARTAHDLTYLCGMIQGERTRDDGRHPYPSVLDASLKEIREKLSEAWRAQ